MQHHFPPLFIQPLWHAMGCVFSADVLQTTWLSNGDLVTPSFQKIPIRWAPGEFNFFVLVMETGRFEILAKHLAQKIYWHKLKEEYDEKLRWAAHVEAWKAKVRSKVASKKAQKNAVSAAVSPKKTEITAAETVTSAKHKLEELEVANCAKVAGGHAKEQLETRGLAPVAEEVKVDAVVEITKEKPTEGTIEAKDTEETKKTENSKAEGLEMLATGDAEPEKKVIDNVEPEKKDEGSESDNSHIAEPKDASTAETTPEVLPKLSHAILFALKSNTELGGSVVGESKKNGKPAKAAKTSKKKEDRKAKKEAKKAAHLALLDQSEMFKLSRLAKA